jgi:hypothetical protein
MVDSLVNDIRSECVEWTKAKYPNGYGHIGRNINGKHYDFLAHRYLWEQEVGPIPEGMVLMHSCDTRACVNMEHLSVGTQAANLEDAFAKGRMPQRFVRQDG